MALHVLPVISKVYLATFREDDEFPFLIQIVCVCDCAWIDRACRWKCRHDSLLF
jgi:hypothetical protein